MTSGQEVRLVGDLPHGGGGGTPAVVSPDQDSGLAVMGGDALKLLLAIDRPRQPERPAIHATIHRLRPGDRRPFGISSGKETGFEGCALGGSPFPPGAIPFLVKARLFELDE